LSVLATAAITGQYKKAPQRAAPKSDDGRSIASVMPRQAHPGGKYDPD